MGVGVGVGWRSTAPSRFEEPSAGSVILHELYLSFWPQKIQADVVPAKII